MLNVNLEARKIAGIEVVKKNTRKIFLVSSIYQSFVERSRELCDLDSTLRLLQWDQETMMPVLGISSRASQIATLATLYHQKLTDPKLGELLDTLKTKELELWLSASVRELYRQYEKATRIPPELVRELAETTSLAYAVWVKARQDSDFDAFGPWLGKIVQLKRQQAICFQPAGSLYDALLDDYEPGVTTQELDKIFSALRPKLSSLLARIQASPKQPDTNVLKGHFPLAKQESFARTVLVSLGFKSEMGRLDVSPHPFCTGLSPQDVRITTRYSENDFTSSFFGTMHEAGHALYEQGLELEHFGLPACTTISLGIHESQSRLWENQVGRSQSFWKYWFPRLKKTFTGQFDGIFLEDFVHVINRVEASLIRVEADEVTYGLHVILRYELEKLLLEDQLPIADLGETWNARMEEYLGISPSRTAEGVLQDTHWSQGLIGYFPTYLLGDLYAAQFFSQAQESISDLDTQIHSGQLISLREWLREQIHRHGKTVSAQQLISDISGEPLRSKFFLDYLENKFGQLYALS